MSRLVLVGVVLLGLAVGGFVAEPVVANPLSAGAACAVSVGVSGSTSGPPTVTVSQQCTFDVQP